MSYNKEYSKKYNKKYYQKYKREHQEYCKQYYIKHKNKFQEYQKQYIKTSKGITIHRVHTWKHNGIILLPQFNTYKEQYEYFYNKANGQCQICNKPLSFLNIENMETACLDHNHLTGEPRGILCGKCNRTIGNIEKTLNGDTQNISKYIATWKI